MANFIKSIFSTSNKKDCCEIKIQEVPVQKSDENNNCCSPKKEEHSTNSNSCCSK